MSPPVPISEVTEAISRCSRAQLAQVALEPAAVVEVARRSWRPGSGASRTPSRWPSSGGRARSSSGRSSRASTPPPPSSSGTQRRQRAGVAQRVDRLAREAGIAIDLVRVDGGHLLGDPPDLRRGRPGPRSTATLMPPVPRSSTRSPSAIAATLSNTLRVSIGRGTRGRRRPRARASGSRSRARSSRPRTGRRVVAERVDSIRDTRVNAQYVTDFWSQISHSSPLSLGRQARGAPWRCLAAVIRLVDSRYLMALA